MKLALLKKWIFKPSKIDVCSAIIYNQEEKGGNYGVNVIGWVKTELSYQKFHQYTS